MRITSKGQVTIPQEIREQLGLLPYQRWSSKSTATVCGFGRPVEEADVVLR